MRLYVFSQRLASDECQIKGEFLYKEAALTGQVTAYTPITVHVEKLSFEVSFELRKVEVLITAHKTAN